MNKYQILKLARTYPTEVTTIKFKSHHFPDFISILNQLPYRTLSEKVKLPTTLNTYTLRLGQTGPLTTPFGYSSVGYSGFEPTIPYTPLPPTIFTRNPHAKEVSLT